MEIVLWVFTAIIFLAFSLAGTSKLLQSREMFITRSGNRATWAAQVSDTQFLLIGTFELLVGSAVLVFRFFEPTKGLSIVASALLATAMVLAILFHIRINDKSINIVPASTLLSLNLVYLLLNSISI